MTFYLWLKAVHVAAVLIFIGGLLSQSLGVAAGARGDARTAVFVSRWDRAVTQPAMLLVWLSGPLIAVEGGWFASLWLWAKLAFVLALTGLHGVQSGRLRRLRNGGGTGADARPFAIAVFIAFSTAMIALLAVGKPF